VLGANARRIRRVGLVLAAFAPGCQPRNEGARAPPPVVATAAPLRVSVAAPAVECAVDSQCRAVGLPRECGRTTEWQAMPTGQVNGNVAISYPKPETGCAPDALVGWAPAGDKVALCEDHRCQLFDGEVAMGWARSVAPVLGQYLPDPKLTFARARWFKPGEHVTLYVRDDWYSNLASPRAGGCVGLDFHAGDDTLAANVTASGKQAPRYGCSETLSLRTGIELLGPHCVEKDGSGSELLEGSARSSFLSEVSEKGLVYDGDYVQLTPQCATLSVSRRECPGRTCRTCQIAFAMQGASQDRGYSLGEARPIEVSGATCGPCLSEQQSTLIPRLAAILGRRSFLLLLEEDSALRFFVKKSDCLADVRRLTLGQGRGGR